MPYRFTFGDFFDNSQFDGERLKQVFERIKDMHDWKDSFLRGTKYDYNKWPWIADMVEVDGVYIEDKIKLSFDYGVIDEWPK